MPSDIEIARNARRRPITEVAAQLGLGEEDLELYGKDKAKVDWRLYERVAARPVGKLIYITAITATPAGEGKTCTAIGLVQALGKLGKKVAACLREPSLGPTFGAKGGAAGGGYAQLLPMEDLNLHFTGDIHAVGAAHNLLAAVLDNHIFRGNALGIDPQRVLWRRVLDMNDRQLRRVVTGLGGKGEGIPRETGFEITAASEIMAILCLATDLADLKERLGRMLVAYTYEGKPVWARDLKVVGALAVLLREALKPNLIQTLEGQPAFVHGGPFANIAHGNSSVIATRLALKLADYVVTEGGFAADLGAEKFFDIVSPASGLHPDVAVLVASVRALKMHGGVSKQALAEKNVAALAEGCANLQRHLDNLRRFGLPVVVAINRFPTDYPEELAFLEKYCREQGVRAAISEVVARGGEGGVDLAREVLTALTEEENTFHPLYEANLPAKEKIALLACTLYGADGVQYTARAEKDLATYEELGLGRLPICMAKTQFSLSDNPELKGAPRGWTLTVREVRASVGAGFLVPLTGEIMTMPGLPRHPAAEEIDLLPDGRIVGLS